MKALIFSDLHVHDYKQHNKDGKRVQIAADIIHYVFKLAAANDISYIWFAGDMGDQFGNISVIAMNALLRTFTQCFDEYPNIEFIAISGNHDFATKNTAENPAESVMDAFNKGPLLPGLFDRFALMQGTFSSNDFTLVGVPYYEDPDDFWISLESSMKHIENHDNLYLLMHQMIWPENDIVPDDVNYKDPRFKQFKWIFNGHVHHASMFGNNFVNVGSPLHRDAGDIDDGKGIWYLDTDKDMPSFRLITDKSPQYISRPYGHKLTDWEKDQYVVWFHPEDKKKKKKGDFDSSKFNVQKVKPLELAENFLDAQNTLEFPKADLMGVASKYFV